MRRNPRAPTAALRDESLRAALRGRFELRFPGGHARSGSGLAWQGDRLAVVQDDTRALVLVDPVTGSVTSVPFGPAGAEAKRDKLDLEALIAVAGELVAFGSGSTAARERILRVRQDSARIIEARALYALLRAAPDFSGSELNLEGATVQGGELVLFQRGNGKPVGALQPVNACARMDLSALLAHLDAPDLRPPPPLRDVVRFELGTLDGVRLGFTDAASKGERIFFLAAAEDSADTYADGDVTGTVIGVIEASGAARWTPIVDADGRPLRAKAEGLALHPTSEREAFIVLDLDDPITPAVLGTLALDGF